MVQGTERPMHMTSRSHTDAGRGRRCVLFLLWACFLHDRMTRCRLRVEAVGTPGRLSSWVARMGRSATLRHHAGQHTATLSWSDGTSCGFPGHQGESQRTCRRHLEEGQGQHPSPSQTVVRSAHPSCGPEPLLCQKAALMLVQDTQARAGRNLFQRHQIIKGEKPPHARTTRGVANRGPRDPDHRAHQIALLLTMHRIPATDRCPSTCGIHSLPHGVRVGLRLWARAVHQRAIRGWRSSRGVAHGCAEARARAFQADQHAVSPRSTGPHHLWGSRPAILQHDHPSQPHQWRAQPQVLESHPIGRLRATDPLGIHGRRSPAWLFRQQPQAEPDYPIPMGVSARGTFEKRKGRGNECLDSTDVC
jgi:hypothetical protein